ncbi:unnamed protein product [Diatraea saccharalis]|uniref:Uncharacterized protein n=1 Tax=Diatraea saccharalis TaxID=40085 RepID=A0A9N9N023_9NEOP|nr:unnamed protein product [Diatraea saccharalis]
MLRSPKPTQRQSGSQIPTPSPRMSLESNPKTPKKQTGMGPQEWGPDMERFWGDLTTIANRIAKVLEVLETQPTLRKDSKDKLIQTLKKTKEKAKGMETTAEEIRTYIEEQEIRFDRLKRENEELLKEGKIMERLSGFEIDLNRKQDNTLAKIEKTMEEWDERERKRMQEKEQYTVDFKTHREIEEKVETPSRIMKKLESIEDNLTAEIIDVGRRMREKAEDSEITIERIIEGKMNEVEKALRNKTDTGGYNISPDETIKTIEATRDFLNNRITHAREETISEVRTRTESLTKKLVEIGNTKERTVTEHTDTKTTYAEVLRERKTRVPKTLHSIIISSDNYMDTAEDVLNKAKERIEAKKEGLRIDRIRKCKDARIIIGCETTEQINKIEDKIKHSKGLKVEKITNKDPLVIIKDIFNGIEDEEMLKAVKDQNSSIFQGLNEEETKMRIKFKKSARNRNTTHVALQIKPVLWQRMTGAGYLHIDLQRVRVEDQSPVIQCTKCLEFGHGRKFCTESADRCSHCGGSHHRTDCPDRDEKPPRCHNCSRSELQDTSHNTFARECPVRAKWDFLARATTAYT